MKANKAGQFGESILAGAMRSIGLTFTQQVTTGRSIYGTELRVDFVVTNLSQFPNGLIVESKWQSGDGSTDEKFPYLAANLAQQPMPSMVVVHGGGCRPCALRWLKAQRDGRHLVDVFTLEEFLSWALRAEKRPRDTFW